MIWIAALLAVGQVAVCKSDVIIQSHRGAGVLAPENTIAAFELGWKLGTYPEADLRTTKDGVIVAFHDGDFSRVVKNVTPELRKKGVADLTWQELSRLDVGGPIARITDVFARMKTKTGPQRHLYLDIKNVDLPALARLVREAGVERQVILASTKYELLVEWKKLMPASGTLHWMGGTEAELEARLEKLRAARFAGITQLQVHVRRRAPAASSAGTAPGAVTGGAAGGAAGGTARGASDEPFTLSRKFLTGLGDELRRHGILYQSLPWGASDAATYKELLDLGVVSFATDHPDVVQAAVRERCAPARSSK